MKTFLTRNEAAELLGVTPQTISNYVAKGILVQSVTKDPSSLQMRILGSSVQRVLNERYDIIAQSQAIDSLRDELINEKESILTEVKKLKEAKELTNIGMNFLNNIKEISEILSAFLVSNNILTRREYSILTDILTGRNLYYIAEKNNLSVTRIKQIYNRSLRVLSLERNLSCEKLMIENKDLKKALELEKQKNESLQELLSEVRLKNETDNSTVKIPEILVGKKSISHLSTRTYNALCLIECENLYDLALITRDMLFNLRNFGQKCRDEIINTMSIYGLRFNDISSLSNPYIEAIESECVYIPRYVLEERSKKLKEKWA